MKVLQKRFLYHIYSYAKYKQQLSHIDCLPSLEEQKPNQSCFIFSGVRFALRDVYEQHVKETIMFRTDIKKLPKKLYVKGTVYIL